MAWRLRRAAASIRSETVALSQLAHLHGPGGQGALLLLMAMPCLLPVPGVGTVLGLGLGALALAMWRGQADGALPARVSALELPRPWARRVLALLARLYAASSTVARPRWTTWASRGERTWMPLLVALMALLIVLPIPFGNVLPAVSLMLLGLGLVFVDGGFVLAALAMGGLATLVPMGLVLAGWHWGGEAVMRLVTGA